MVLAFADYMEVFQAGLNNGSDAAFTSNPTTIKVRLFSRLYSNVFSIIFITLM